MSLPHAKLRLSIEPVRAAAAARGLCAALAAAALLLAGCARFTPPAVLITDAGGADFEDALAASFARGAALLSGIDEPSDDRAWRPGDRVLFGIQLQDQGSGRVWFVLIELLAADLPVRTEMAVLAPEAGAAPEALPRIVADGAPAGARVAYRATAPPWGVNFRIREASGRVRPVSVDSTSIFARLRVYDGEARWIGDSYAFAPQDFLREGLIAQVLLMRGLYQGLPPGAKLPVSKMTDDQLHRAVRATAGVFAVGRTLWQAPPLKPIFDGMVARPSILSIIANLGIRVSVDLRAQDATEEVRVAARLGGDQAAQLVPLEVKINGQAAMRTELIAADPRCPLHLCAGVIGLETVHVEHPERRLVARLLAARRGPLPASAPAAHE